MKHCCMVSSESPSVGVETLLQSQRCFGAGGSCAGGAPRPVLETHQTSADACVFSIRHLLKAHHFYSRGCCYWNRSESSRRCTQGPRPASWAPGAAAHVFTSEPETGTAAIGKAEELLQTLSSILCWLQSDGSRNDTKGGVGICLFRVAFCLPHAHTIPQLPRIPETGCT